MDSVDEGMVDAVAAAIHDASGRHIPDMGAWHTEARRYPDYGDRVRDEATAAIDAMRQYIAHDDTNWKLAGMYVDGRAVEINTVTRELRFKEEKA